ncbi:hypothetical protein CAPTEDRAFT_214851 [Capitella teleta]|uniref:Uncharacterized protein n=1 Tax=Capitella teleta TaxID=283909 RepID=R7VCT1_CAPTE|nr:hypothetical protein CAPTEDRAFT_214851 [Capitella teleta]|eukprot:ELU16633.1 hypothetical protein CAPTEDRAFT_214851 [Capitella teleta]
MSASSQYSSGFGLVVYRLGRARSSPAPPSSAIRLKPVQAKPEVKFPIAEMPRSHPMKKLISVDTTSSLTIAQTPTTAIIKAYHTVPRNIKKARMIQTIRVGLRETHPNLTRFLHLEKVNDRLQSVSKSCYFPAIDEYEDDEVGGQEFHLPRDKYCDLAIVDRIHARSQPVPTIDNPNLPGIPPNRLVITSTLRGERRPAKSQVTRRKLDRFSAWKKRRHSSEHLEEYVEESVVGRPRGSKSLQMAERGSRFKEKGEASAFFKKAVKRATCILSWTKMLKNQYDSLTDQLKTFVDIARVAEELDDNKDAIRQKAGLAFNRKEFIANKEVEPTNNTIKMTAIESASSSYSPLKYNAS